MSRRSKKPSYYVDVDSGPEFLDDVHKVGTYLYSDGSIRPLFTDEELDDLPNLAKKLGRLKIPPPPDR